MYFILKIREFSSNTDAQQSTLLLYDQRLAIFVISIKITTKSITFGLLLTLHFLPFNLLLYYEDNKNCCAISTYV